MRKYPLIIRILKNKYLLAFLFFVVWMIFFDPKDWSLIHSRTQKLNELHQSEQKINDQIADTKQELSLLKTNAQTIEKYAREKYYMKKDNEELFVVKLTSSTK